jgi:hypothetical protein
MVRLFGLAMNGVAAIMRAVFLDFQARRVILFILFSRIIAVLALAAGERDDETILFFGHYSATFEF